MPSDITMCAGGDCPLRQRCYRYRSVPAGRQDYFGAMPYDAARGACDQLWDIARLGPTDDAIRTRAYHLWQAAGEPTGAADAHWQAARAALTEAAEAELRHDLP